MEENFGIMNTKYKGTIMKVIRSSKDGLYYPHASKIQHKPVMTAMICEINDDKKQKDTEEERYKNTIKIYLTPKTGQN